MTTHAATSLRPAARAASHPRASGPETLGFVATCAPHPIATTFPRAATGAVAASVRVALVPSSADLPARPRAAARAASSIARG